MIRILHFDSMPPLYRLLLLLHPSSLMHASLISNGVEEAKLATRVLSLLNLDTYFFEHGSDGGGGDDNA